MSWRAIFIALLFMAAASAWAGLQLGEWLVAYGPTITNAPDDNRFTIQSLLDADGKPFTPAPPQPLVDGRLAIPQAPAPIDWDVADKSLIESEEPLLIAVATTSITMHQAQQISGSGPTTNGGLLGIADAGALMDSLNQGSAMPLQPIEMPEQLNNQPVINNNAAPAPRGNWQAELQQALKACEAESFFDRPSCAWTARNRYCTPNNAWGQIQECPER